jgi:ribosomal subunit interface protein
MINISTRQFELTDTIDGKIKKAFEKHATLVKKDSLFDIHLERTTNHHKQGEVYRMEASVKSAGDFYHAESAGEDVYVLVDEVADKLQREIVEGGERRRTLDRSLSRKMKDKVKQFKFW